MIPQFALQMAALGKGEVLMAGIRLAYSWAQVAAHLYDLEAAKRCGYQTIYVERGEERADEAEVARMRQEGIVDLWVTAAEDGFLTVAEKLGCKLDSS